MELIVKGKDGKDTGRKVTLSEEVFGIEPNEHVVWLDVKQYLANQRQGTHKSKERAEVNRTTKKLYRQKGTGSARHGSRRAPIFVGGGRVFGPRPRDYGFKVNKKVKSLAKRSVLSSRAQENKISIVENFTFDAPRTKDYLTFLNSMELNGQKTLLVTPAIDHNVYLSSRNLPKTSVTAAAQINTYDLMNADILIFCEGAIEVIETMLKK
ncbi:MAG: large subunit ribosomal protein L4 [Spirosomataceae bacterium]|jgi:large subunit ribosomal protein L4